MEWFNVFGLVFMIVIMIPNIIYAVRRKDGFENNQSSKALQTAEQIGRFGCIVFMIFNIPKTWFGWWSDEAFAVYFAADCALVILYCAAWIFLKKSGTFRAIALSVIPSVIFLFSGVMSRSVPLVISALIFAPAHVLISYKNSK